MTAGWLWLRRALCRHRNTVSEHMTWPSEDGNGWVRVRTRWECSDCGRTGR